MACNLITAPTGGAPLTTADYDAQNNYITAAINRLLSDQLHLTEWATLVKPEIAEGVYVQHGGALFQVRDSTEAITGAPAAGRVYIRVTRTGNVLTFDFITSAVGYSWNFIYNGFYHADGTQLLPYILYRSAGAGNDWYKFDLTSSLNKFSITEKIFKEWYIDTGAWNMNVSVAGVSSVNINHTIFSINNIKSVFVLINQDPPSTLRFPLYRFSNAADPSLMNGGIQNITTVNMTLAIRTGGQFDSAFFDDAVINRGIVNVTEWL